MLSELSIRDLALIEALELEFGPGLNVISGETGAGKSLLVGSLTLLLGETPKGGAAKWVRKGSDEARVEGRFELRGAAAIERVREVLRAEIPAVAEAWESGLEGDTAELFLGRSLTAAGRTRAHVEQRPVPLRALKRVAPRVLEIHGQNDHQRLLVPSEQLRLIDLYGGLARDVARYREARSGWRDLVSRFERLEAERAERRDRRDLVAFQIEELAGAELQPGEHAELREERELLRNAGDLRAELGGAVTTLVESDGALVDRLRSVVHVVERWHAKLERLGAPLEDLRSAEIHLGEAASALASLVDGVPSDPARLDAVEERLAELERFEAKYARDEEGLLALLPELEAELGRLVEDDASLEVLTAEIEVALASVDEAAGKLREKRQKLAPRLVRGVETALGALGLAKARLEIAFTDRAAAHPEPEERFGPGGAEDVEFLLAANPGEDPGPLRHVASGGEAARIMLALRTELQPKKASGGTRTLVFDEIDAGVGGRLGPAVGAHLKQLAAREQVLCVTHIPAIAAAADLHLRTSKEVKRGRTRTTIVRLTGDDRVHEVADMIAGGAAHATARAEAQRLLAETSV